MQAEESELYLQKLAQAVFKPQVTDFFCYDNEYSMYYDDISCLVQSTKKLFLEFKISHCT